MYSICVHMYIVYFTYTYVYPRYSFWNTHTLHTQMHSVNWHTDGRIFYYVRQCTCVQVHICVDIFRDQRTTLDAIFRNAPHLLRHMVSHWPGMHQFG